MTHAGSIDAGTSPDTTIDEAPGRAGMAPTEAVLREIARGGLAGLIAGVLVAGVGGRIVMRLAALLVPAADGAITENGNVVGTITFGGSLALVLFIGLFFGIVAGSLWVVIQSWLPATPLRRTVAAVPVAVALGTVGLIDARNPDFGVLGHSPPVVASLVVLVALFAPVLVLAERWLDGRLPRPGPTDRAVVAGYTIVTMIGSLLTVFAVLPLYLGPRLMPVGIALAVVGLATLTSWWRRIGPRRPAGRRLTIVARVALALATVAGLAISAGEVAGALDVG